MSVSMCASVDAMVELKERILDVLLVDDSPDVGSVIAVCLQHLGHRITVAVSDVEAAAFLNRGYFDVLVADVAMPDSGGVRAIEEVKKRYPSTRILVMGDNSGIFDSSASFEFAGMFGAHAALLKPFTAGQFLDALKAIVPSSDTSAPFLREIPEKKRSEIIGG